MMNDQGLVVGIEHIKEISEKSIKNISKNHKNLLDENKIIIVNDDGIKGCSEYAFYDCIHVGAAAEKVPKALLDQLANGGRMVVPVGKYYQFIYVIDKDLKGNITSSPELTVRYVPLTSKEKQLNSYYNIFY